MDIERAVMQHYADADLLARILAGLRAAGLDPQRLRPEDLAPVEEFHIGGRKATEHAVSKLSLDASQQVLDVGCGIGGAARHMAAQTGCQVSGIDLTPDYIACAKTLTGLVGLQDKVRFGVASALALPFGEGCFDAVITLHAAMNIARRVAMYREIARVARPGATLCIFDVMKNNDADLDYPVPWAQSPHTSHLTTPREMCTLLQDAGFDIREIEDRTEFAIEFFRSALAGATDRPPPLGVHLIMGASAPEKFRNTLQNIEQGRIAPVLMIATRTQG